MKESRRFLAMTLVLVLVAAIAAGCQQSAPGSNAASSNVPASEKQSEAPAASGAEPQANSELSGDCVLWTWSTEEAEKPMLDGFRATYPNVNVVLTSFPKDDMPMKIQTTLASGGEMPQIVFMGMEHRGKLLMLDCWEDLSADPYNLSKSDMLDFLLPVSITPSGKWACVEGGLPAAGLSYKRDMAKQYLGTDDPDELANKFKTWDQMYEAGLKINQETGGTVYLTGSIQEFSLIIGGQNPEPYVLNGKLNIEAALSPVFDTLIKFYSAGLIGPMDMWGPEWNASFSEKTYLFNACAVWFRQIIEMNAPETSGNWVLAVPPEGGFMYSGASVAIPSAAKNKEVALEYIRWNFLSENGAIPLRDDMGGMSAYAPLYKDDTFFSNPNPFFGGQDYVKTFAQKIAPNMAKTRPVDQYDVEVQDALNAALMTIKETNGNITSAQLIESMSAEILNKVPELK